MGSWKTTWAAEQSAILYSWIAERKELEDRFSTDNKHLKAKNMLSSHWFNFPAEDYYFSQLKIIIFLKNGFLVFKPTNLFEK